jgi:hypothetical protein
MLRKPFALLVVLLASTLGWSSVAQAHAAQTFDAEQIKAVLHTATPEEGGFVTWVVALVNRGKLPAALFESTLLWAKKKPAHHRFQYFKRALVQRATAAGIDLSHKPCQKPPPNPPKPS